MFPIRLFIWYLNLKSHKKNSNGHHFLWSHCLLSIVIMIIQKERTIKYGMKTDNYIYHHQKITQDFFLFHWSILTKTFYIKDDTPTCISQFKKSLFVFSNKNWLKITILFWQKNKKMKGHQFCFQICKNYFIANVNSCFVCCNFNEELITQTIKRHFFEYQ